MQPTFKQVPPNSLSFSTRAVFKPSWPERMAATYPPGPEPMITTSNFSILAFCHSERSEESHYFSPERCAQSNNQRCFASLNMTRESHVTAVIPNEAKNLRSCLPAPTDGNRT